VRHPFTSAARVRAVALSSLIVLAVAGCGGSDPGASRPAATAAPAPATTTAAAAAPTPAAACHRAPGRIVRAIATHANRRTRFSLRSAAAVPVGPGYAVSVMTVAGGEQRMGTWYVDDLKAPGTVTSGNPQALEITNWPLDPIAADPAGQSRFCASKFLRGTVGPVG
jgi:hypothetical protein